MRRLLSTAVLATLVAALLPAAAAALDTQACVDAATFRCATLPVPIDRTGGVPGTIGLKVGFQPGDKPVLVALTGGPGQPGVAYGPSFARTLRPALKRYRLAVVDQRGTGRSGMLRCPALQALTGLEPFTPGKVRGCADAIGPRRAFYGTADTVDDLEALRQALGVPTLALMGVSYGTYVALQYARTYPEHVDRLILDSTVGPDGVDPFVLDTFERLPRVLRSLCTDGACAEATGDALGDLTTVARRLGAGTPLVGRAFDARGIAHETRISDAGELAAIVTAGDLNPGLLALLPGAMRAAAAGDPAPLVRLRAIADGRALATADLSFGLNAATSCDDTALPYALSDSAADRVLKLRDAAAALAAPTGGPFPRAAVVRGSVALACMRWPAAPLPRPVSRAPLPDVPALILGGTLDTRTPIENAHEVAALLPHATVVEVPGNGHDELDTDWTGCTTAAVDRFVRDVPVERPCEDESLRPAIAARPPLRLAGVRPTQRIPGDRGRVAAAALATVDDALNMASASIVAGLAGDAIAGGGLRGGRYEFVAGHGFRLTGDSYVPGVRVTGQAHYGSDLALSARLRVDGPGTLDGTVTVTRGGRVTARLGGRTVDGSVRSYGSARANGSARAYGVAPPSRSLTSSPLVVSDVSLPAWALAPPPLSPAGGRGKVHSVDGSFSHGE